MDTNNNDKNNNTDKKVKRTRTKKQVLPPVEVELDSLPLDSLPFDSLPLQETKEKKVAKRVKKVKETVKIIQELNDNEKENNTETIEDKEEDKEEDEDVHEKESNIVTEKNLDISAAGEEKEVYGYLIIQEFPHINTTYVIGSKPFGKVWFDYTEVLEQFITILIDWQVDFDNKEIVHSKKPRIVKIRVF